MICSFLEEVVQIVHYQELSNLCSSIISTKETTYYMFIYI